MKYANPDPDFGQAQRCGGVKPINGIPSHLDIWISNANRDMNNQQQKTCTDSLVQKLYTNYKNE